MDTLGFVRYCSTQIYAANISFRKNTNKVQVKSMGNPRKPGGNQMTTKEKDTLLQKLMEKTEKLNDIFVRDNKIVFRTKGNIIETTCVQVCWKNGSKVNLWKYSPDGADNVLPTQSFARFIFTKKDKLIAAEYDRVAKEERDFFCGFDENDDQVAFVALITQETTDTFLYINQSTGTPLISIQLHRYDSCLSHLFRSMYKMLNCENEKEETPNDEILGGKSEDFWQAAE
jgi:hypothetical protein